MKLMVVVAFVVVLALGGVIYALMTLSTDVRQVAKNVEALTNVVNTMSQDVSTLSTDVQDIADAIAGEPETGEAEPCPARRYGRRTHLVRHPALRRTLATRDAPPYRLRPAAGR